MKDDQIRDLRIKSDLAFNLCCGLRRALTEIEMSQDTADIIIDSISRLSALQKQINNQITFNSLENVSLRDLSEV